ncbi:MAB_1171c family putative transporter [Streptomyces sp. SP2-10]|uniref:MAB_1171c family putative transporter n=1 Tax=Streptomyces sp. SP2-10 TaxID=2873385 RepID=UPI0027E18892|nr:MAB_1171c family putative transporter [Streptomyces sp. SP2-10]
MTLAAPDPSGFLSGFYISFWIPAAVLAAALAIKLPTIIRLWRDPLLRAVGALLLLACAVFVFCVPSTIARVNRVTGVPNVSAPWCYSLITAFSGSCLLLIVTWRNGPSGRSAATRRAMRWVFSAYSGVIVALWVLFLLAGRHEERLRDLDTYYATTPFLREEILLYLAAHTVACLITARLIRDWVRAEGLDAWLRRGLRLLGAGYAANLVFDAAKLTAVTARWFGRNPDWLSTDLAPPVAALSAVLVAVGFILPPAGQYLRDRRRVRLAHRELRPLYRLLRGPSGAGVPFALRATPELRLTRRETFIRDVLLPLDRHIDTGLGARSYDAALTLGHPPERARALAAAVCVLDAVERSRTPKPPGPAGGPGTGNLLHEIGAVSRALRRAGDIEAVRARAAGLSPRTPVAAGPGPRPAPPAGSPPTDAVRADPCGPW